MDEDRKENLVGWMIGRVGDYRVEDYRVEEFRVEE